MTSDEFNAALDRLGLTHHSAAERLGMGRHGWQSVRDWSRGERDVPGPVALALQLLALAREVQWSATIDLEQGGYAAGCPICEQLESEGHTPDCRMGEAAR